MAHSTLKRIPGKDAKNVKSVLDFLSDHSVKVGWSRSAVYAPENGKAQGEFVATVAARNELGAGVPARPFLRPAISENKKSWFELATKSLREALKGQLAPAQILNRIGIQATEDIKESINKVWNPPLSEATIKRRLERYKNKTKVGDLRKPLIDTGYMIATVTSEVSKE